MNTPVAFLEHRQVCDVKADINYASGEEIPTAVEIAERAEETVRG